MTSDIITFMYNYITFVPIQCSAPVVTSNVNISTAVALNTSVNHNRNWMFGTQITFNCSNGFIVSTAVTRFSINCTGNV